jgi:hypothetical protein
MGKRKPGILLGMLLLAAIFLTWLPAVRAQGNWPCGEVVADQAGVLGSGRADVQDAAERLIALGADVRVFTVRTTGLDNLDLFVDGIEKSCLSWQAPDGDLGSAEKELVQERPDYPGLLARFKEVHEVADRALAQARDEHETIERLRQKYEGALRQVQGALSTAGNYLRDHPHDVGRDVRSTLEQAAQTLRTAQERRAQADQKEDTARREALEAALALVQQAAGQSSSAYSRAQRDVRRAEESRQPAFTPLVPAGTGPWSGGWGTPRPSPRQDSGHHEPSGGGSSTSWGIASPGGGSSTSWGSSPKRRGGGSTGW